MTGCFEVVVYQVANSVDADRERSLAMERIKTFHGFRDWLALSNPQDKTARVDLVTWASETDAQQAAAQVEAAPEFAAFRETISQVLSMGHYMAARQLAAPVAAKTGAGIELGRFRLKPQVREQDMRAAYQRMLAQHLQQQPGWQGQYLVKLQDGVFVDLAFASTQDHAASICQSWQGNAACEAFLGMIEPIAMEFGSIIETGT